MAINIMMRLIVNQTNIVLNFSLSVGLRLASAEPIVNKTTAVNMQEICMKRKNREYLSNNGFLK